MFRSDFFAANHKATPHQLFDALSKVVVDWLRTSELRLPTLDEVTAHHDKLEQRKDVQRSRKLGLVRVSRLARTKGTGKVKATAKKKEDEEASSVSDLTNAAFPWRSLGRI